MPLGFPRPIRSSVTIGEYEFRNTLSLLLLLASEYDFKPVGHNSGLAALQRNAMFHAARGLLITDHCRSELWGEFPVSWIPNVICGVQTRGLDRAV
jgi:hypothetical protein